MKTKARHHIGISGSYGGLNLGDEAILTAMIRQIRTSLPAEITVFSRDSQDTLQRHKVEHAVDVRNLTRAEVRRSIADLDLFILGGGGLLFDAEVEIFLREVFLAHELHIPVMIYAISAGPLLRAASRKLVCDALNQAALITVRDRLGRQLLEDIGVTQTIHVTADPALLLEPESLPNSGNIEGIDLNARLVGFSIREPGPAAPEMDVDHYHLLIANAADFMVHRLDVEIIFIPMERKMMDMQHSHAVVSRMRSAQRATVLKGDYSPGQILSLMQHFDFAVGMRLHFLIFAAHAGVPFVPLPYADKVSGFIEDLDFPMPPLDHVSAGHLIARIDWAWDNRSKIHDHILSKLPEVRNRSLQTTNCSCSC